MDWWGVLTGAAIAIIAHRVGYQQGKRNEFAKWVEAQRWKKYAQPLTDVDEAEFAAWEKQFLENGGNHE